MFPERRTQHFAGLLRKCFNINGSDRFLVLEGFV